MIHAGGNARLRAGVQYVLFNLLGSTLFLFRSGRHLCGDRHAEHGGPCATGEPIDPRRHRWHSRRAVLLLLVFAIKAAVVPLHFWLPSSYAEAPAPVAALFAIMTKVGAYAIIRVYTMIFPPDWQ